MNKSPRIGLLLAPLVIPVALTVSVALLGDDPTQKDSLSFSDPIMRWVLVLGTVTLFSYLATILFGVPLVRVLRRLDRLSFWLVVPAGAFFGAIAPAIVIFSTGGYIVGPIWGSIAKLAVGGAVLGVLVSTSYCWLAGSGDWPNKSLERTRGK
jgi:hypothetical protein